MDVLKNEILSKLNKPYRLFCLLALLLCVCTDVPEHCGDRYPALNPSTEVCGEDGRPQPKGGTAPATYAVTVTGGAGATGSGSYAAGTTVKITAGTPPSGQAFKNWTTSSSGVVFSGAGSASTSFTMPANTVKVTAVFEAIKYAVTVASAGTGKSGDGSYEAGETVTIKAGTPPIGQQFKNWTTTGAGVTLADANNATTTFTMPKNAVTATANFETPVVEPVKYIVVVNGGTEATGGGSYTAGTIVNITMGTAPSGQQFKNWTTTSAGVTFVNANSPSTSFTMPANNVAVTANFEAAKYTVTVTGGTGGGSYAAGATVSISAGSVPSGQKFDKWTSSGGVTFADASSSSTTFTMPANNVTVTANFEAAKYTVTVSSIGTNVTGGGSYAAGATVTITAGSAPSGQVFDKWTSSGSGVTFADANSPSTSFTMPANAVTVTANWKQAWVDGGALNYEGQSYRTAIIGGKRWMAENLNITTTGSWCYGEGGEVVMSEGMETLSSSEIQANCNKYGRLYRWAAAKTACPEGWHLPSRDEWGDLAKAAGGTGDYGAGGTAGKKLKATSGWGSSSYNGTDDYGFSALPSGGYNGVIFHNAGGDGYWWTTTGTDDVDYAYVRHMHYHDNNVYEMSGNRGSGFAVRCLVN